MLTSIRTSEECKALVPGSARRMDSGIFNTLEEALSLNSDVNGTSRRNSRGRLPDGGDARDWGGGDGPRGVSLDAGGSGASRLHNGGLRGTGSLDAGGGGGMTRRLPIGDLQVGRLIALGTYGTLHEGVGLARRGTAHPLGPARFGSPRHRKPFNSTYQGSKAMDDVVGNT